MIYKNDDGSNVIQFGTGDIYVGNGRVSSNDEKHSYPCCSFTEQKAGEIGRGINRQQENKVIKENEVHTLFVFTDIKSIDVLIEQLTWSRERFEKNGLKNMNNQQIQDELEG